MFLGSISIGHISDRYGRRNGTLFALACITAFGSLAIVAPSFNFLVLCRFGVGVGLGSSPAAMTLFSEVLPVTARYVQRMHAHLISFIIAANVLYNYVHDTMV